VTQSRRRVAITGLGLVTPAGNDVATTWSALLAARSAVAPIRTFDASGFPVRIAAEVKDFEPERVIDDRKLLKSANRSHRFALAAAEQAMRDAGIAPTPETRHALGLRRGTGMMGVPFEDLADVHRRAAPSGELDTDRLLAGDGRQPIRWCSAAVNRPPASRCSCAGSASAGTRLSAHGVRVGGQAIGTALKVIRRGIADRALAGGFDSMINPVGLAGFCLLNAVSPDNDTPERAAARSM
jgi:3-oxoacyl-(acyl-carrier-protein) synthase